MQVAYLTALKKYREVGCPIVYDDETYVLSCLTGHKNWSDHCVRGLVASVLTGRNMSCGRWQEFHSWCPSYLQMEP